MISIMLVLLAAGPGGSLSGGRLPTVATNTIYIAGSGTTAFSGVAYTDSAVLEVRWVSLTSGIGNEMVLSLMDDGAEACSINVDCDAAASTVVTKACSATVAQGSVVTVDVDRSGCIVTSPTGNLSYTIQR